MAIKAYKTETVTVKGNKITIEYITNPSFPLTKIYQNKKTRALDEKFRSEIETQQLGLESLTSPILAAVEVQDLVSYYLELTKEAGKFFGFNEQEFIDNIEKMATLSRAPCLSPGLNKALKGQYFHKIKVKQEEVIFPYNL